MTAFTGKVQLSMRAEPGTGKYYRPDRLPVGAARGFSLWTLLVNGDRQEQREADDHRGKLHLWRNFRKSFDTRTAGRRECPLDERRSWGPLIAAGFVGALLSRLLHRMESSQDWRPAA
jgi:hypothetical protein